MQESKHLRLVRRLAVLAVAMLAVAPALAPAQEPPDPQSQLVRLDLLRSAGMYSDALEGLDELLARDDLEEDVRVEALVLRGRCYVGLDRVVAGREAFAAALVLDPGWQPDPQLFTDRGMGVFNEAKREAEAAATPAVIMPTAVESCPSATAPLISSGAFAGALIWNFSAKSTANDRWERYEADPTHPQDLFDSYEDAHNQQKVAGYVSIGTGVVTGYLWWRYIDKRNDCDQEASTTSRTGLSVTPRAIVVSYRF